MSNKEAKNKMDQKTLNAFKRTASSIFETLLSYCFKIVNQFVFNLVFSRVQARRKGKNFAKLSLRDTNGIDILKAGISVGFQRALRKYQLAPNFHTFPLYF